MCTPRIGHAFQHVATDYNIHDERVYVHVHVSAIATSRYSQVRDAGSRQAISNLEKHDLVMLAWSF